MQTGYPLLEEGHLKYHHNKKCKGSYSYSRDALATTIPKKNTILHYMKTISKVDNETKKHLRSELLVIQVKIYYLFR